MLNLSFAEKRIARSIRTGSSANLVFGSPINLEASLNIRDTINEVDYFIAIWVVVKCVGCKITSKSIFVQRSKGVITQNHAFIVMHYLVRDRLAKGRYFYKVASKSHMHNGKSFAYDARSTEQLTYVF